MFLWLITTQLLPLTNTGNNPHIMSLICSLIQLTSLDLQTFFFSYLKTFAYVHKQWRRL